LQVDLGEPQSIDTVRAVCYNADNRSYAYKVQGSTDAKEWSLLADFSQNKTPSTAVGYVHRFDPAKVRYVRLFDIKNSSNPSVHVNELEVYAAGKAPKTFAAAAAAAPAKVAIQAPPLPAPGKDGFISLFNGKDLSGWMGSTGGYAVEDGLLVCKEKGGGKLLTMHRFSDFVLRFEFKMPPGANNGLAVRAPADGNPAYAGMELQIIDNKGYKAVHNYELQPWQTRQGWCSEAVRRMERAGGAGRWAADHRGRQRPDHRRCRHRRADRDGGRQGAGPSPRSAPPHRPHWLAGTRGARRVPQHPDQAAGALHEGPAQRAA
jgi:hypothetical protein